VLLGDFYNTKMRVLCDNPMSGAFCAPIPISATGIKPGRACIITEQFAGRVRTLRIDS